ncbi:hypothetical protein MMC25_003155 [Agyrium rufum]|nr:hypothetical protein [Agyrium rufum]
MGPKGSNPPDDPTTTDVFVPRPFVRRPTFFQILQASANPGRLLQPPDADDAVNLPSFLLEGLPFTHPESESAKRREKLYRGTQDAALFEPAESEKENMEIAMKAKENYERDLLKLLAPGSQTMGSVVEEITRSWADWQLRPRKLAKARDYFIAFSKTVSQFTQVFDLIPNQTDYTSTLCGAIKLIVNAAVNYESMAEGFARALLEIGQELGNAKDLQALYDTPEMGSLVISLYSHILKFLCFSMKWIKGCGSAKRFITSFSDGGYWSKAEVFLKPVKILAKNIKDIADKAQTRRRW